MFDDESLMFQMFQKNINAKELLGLRYKRKEYNIKC